MFCHFRISVAGSPPQTVVFQLHTDKCPKTCDNFIALCQSSATAKRPSSSSSSSSANNNIPANANVQQPTYRGTEFHRILPGFMIQGGDFTKFDGSGGRAARATNKGQATFPDENFDVSHDKEGVLSMANRGKNTNGSQFFITLGKTLHLDKKHVAFGEVVRGMEAVREIARVETEGNNGKPVMLQRVVIVDCGVGMGDDDDDAAAAASDSDGDGSGSSSSASSRGKKKRSKKKKHRRSSRSDDEDSHRKKKKRSRDGSSHSKHRKRSDKEDRRRRKHKDTSSHRRRSSRDSSSSEDERRGHSSKKRHKSRDRKSDR